MRLSLPANLIHVADWRAPVAAAASVAAMLALTVGLSAAGSTPVGSEAGARRIAAATGGDLREAALQAMVEAMDPAAQALARRHDPQAFEPDVPAFALDPDAPSLFDLPPIEGEAAQRINQAIPFQTEARLPAAPFVLKAVGAERDRAVRCLTNAIYYEAALEPVDGQRAVAQVVLNRVRDPNFPKSVCGVVYQGWERYTGCQFSFTCDGALVHRPVAALWNENRKVAEAALAGFVMTPVGTATHYHADYVAPYWAPTLVKLTQIGAHIFYRWPGDAGLPAALNAAYRGGELRLSEAILTGQAARPAPPATASGAGVSAAAAKALPSLRTVEVADAGGKLRTRVTASFEPAQYGRRQPTPEEVARINALLEERFPTKPAEPAAAAAPAPVSPPSAG